MESFKTISSNSAAGLSQACLTDTTGEQFRQVSMTGLGAA
jgi:hypothetical protein